MTIKARARRWLEEKLQRFYEGPEPPPRYRDEALAFSLLHPDAGHQEWIDFARDLAGTSYRDGYVRGHERHLRDPEGNRPVVDAELAAEAARHEWAASQDELARRALLGSDPRDPLMGLTPEQRYEVLLGMSHASGGSFQVEVPRHPDLDVDEDDD